MKKVVSHDPSFNLYNTNHQETTMETKLLLKDSFIRKNQSIM